MKFDQKFQQEAAASLVQTVRDENALYNARVQAARDILSYSHGKPGQARPIAVTDIAAMSEEQRQELLYALLNHYMPSGFQSLLEQACNEAVEQYEQSLIQHHQPRRFQRSGDAALPPPSTHEESAIPATLEARSAARAIADGNEHSGLQTPSETPALGATLSASDASSNRLSHALTHEPDGVAISDRESASKPPLTPADDSRIAPREPVYRFSGIPIDRLLSNPPEATASGKITAEILRRSAMRDPVNWR